MAESHRIIERTKVITGLIELHPLLTNAEIAERLLLPYRAVQRITCKLANDGVIVGYVNSYGGWYSNVGWRINPRNVGGDRAGEPADVPRSQPHGVFI